MFFHIDRCLAADESVRFRDSSSTPSELSLILEKTGPGVVTIVSYDATGAESKRGSGFFIDNEGRILTNADLLKDAYSAEVFSDSNHYKQVSILNRSENADLTVIRVHAKNELPLSFSDSQPIHAQDKVFIIGKKEYFLKTLSEGIIDTVSSSRHIEEILFIKARQMPSDFRPSIDGPVLNINGEVIGLITKTRSDNVIYDRIANIGDTRNYYAIGLKAIKAFLEEEYHAISLNPPKSRVWTEWVMKQMANAFVYLYDYGFSGIMKVLIAIVILLLLVQWLFMKIKSIFVGDRH
jgi:hypothetical protein